MTLSLFHVNTNCNIKWQNWNEFFSRNSRSLLEGGAYLISLALSKGGAYLKLGATSSIYGSRFSIFCVNFI